MSGAPVQLRFDDGKEPDALRTIGEVAEGLGIKQHVLRYWEQQFPTLNPLKRSGGRRYYRPDDVKLVALIDRLVNREGYTLKGARQAIAKVESPAPPSAPPAMAASTSVPTAEVRERLAAIRDRLDKALAAG